MRRLGTASTAVLASILTALVLVACGIGGGGPDSTQQRKKSNEFRTAAMNRAEGVAPLSGTKNVNFPLRKLLIEWNNRSDLVNHPWYVYIRGDQGNVIAYYVATTQPVSTCNFLSSTQDVDHDDNGNLILTAPSIDGMFYGGSGAEGGCGWVLKDYNSSAIVVLAGNTHFDALDKPLNIDAEAIRIKG